MTLHIRNPTADLLARQLAAKLNTSVTNAVIDALRERLANAPAHPDSWRQCRYWTIAAQMRFWAMMKMACQRDCC
jgi:hypothetical protein